MEATMWNNYGYGMGPGMMGSQPPQVIYVPMPTPVGPQMPPLPPNTSVKMPKAKMLSAKKIAKIAGDWNKLLEDANKSGGAKKDDKKDKKITEKMFTFFETCLLLIVTSIPVGLAMLLMLKTAMSMARTLLAM